MRTLRFIVDGQIIMADPGCDFSDLIPGSEKYLQAEFLFSPDWDGLSKTAVFYSALGYKYEPQTLSDGKTCIIPADALKKRIFKVQVCGENTDGSIVPTNKIIVAQTGNSVTTPSTPSTAIKLLTELYLNTTFGPDSAYNANVINAVIQDILESKQDNLVSGENIKTINGQSIVGPGDIPIESGSGSEFNIVEVATDGEFEPTDIYNAIGMNEVIIGLLAMIDEIEPSIIAKFDTIFKTKQDILVSGESIKTINGQSVLGSGDIPIEGGSDVNIIDFDHDNISEDTVFNDNDIYNANGILRMLFIIEDAINGCEFTGQKTNIIDENSDDFQYPSAKAAYEYGQSILAEVRGDLDTVEALVGGVE